MKTLPLILSLLLLALGPVWAEEPPPPPTQDEDVAASPASEAQSDPGAGGFLQSPQVQPSPVAGDSVEPDITIRDEGGQLVYEYRVNGQLYMVKIQPQIGPPYFLLDTNGDGQMDVREHAPRDNHVPQWVLFRWN